jgi:hypothetical protein
MRNISLFNNGGHTIPIRFNPEHYNIDLGYMAVIVGSGAVAGLVADMVFDGGIYTIFGALAGAVLGDQWYQRSNAAATVNIPVPRGDKPAENISYPKNALPLGHVIASS